MNRKKFQISKQKMKYELFRALTEQGYVIRGSTIIPPNVQNKNDIRKLHTGQKKTRLQSDLSFFEKYGLNFINTYFASGNEIDPSKFDPELIPVQADHWTGNLFRLATMIWSVPVSKGYGRRIRFLVMDRSNKKLVGIIGLGDPVFNLKVRDEHIGWNSNDRKERLFNVMDAYVLGAVPPYNVLLAGKFLAGIISTNEIREFFSSKYKETKTIIQKKVKPADLVLVTTTSALGRSSVYNRVFYDSKNGRLNLLQSIGFTSGYGHFHVPEDVFTLMRAFLSERNDRYADGHQYGNGPNWRMRVIRKVMQLLGYSKTPVLKHGIQREVFISPLATNYKEYLCGRTDKPEFIDLPLEHYTEYFKNRFMLPRFERRKSEVLKHKAQDVYNEIYNFLFEKEELESVVSKTVE